MEQHQAIDPRRRSRTKRARFAVDGGTTGLFLLAILAPTFDQMVRPVSAREPRHENRKARALPDAPTRIEDVSSLPAALEAHHADTFGCRDFLLRWNSLLKMGVWGLPPTPIVVLDESGWLDYAGEHTFEVWRGMQPMTQVELDRWTSYLENCRAFCARNHARFWFVTAPNKETIYPDHVPSRFKPLGPTRLDQIVAALPDATRSAFLDLRPALAAARSQDVPRDHLYFESGTHWNGRGGWVAYQAMMDRIAPEFPGVRRLNESDLDWDVNPATDFDSWGPRLYQPGSFQVQTRMPMVKGPQLFEDVEGDVPHGPWHVRNPTLSGPRILVISDSFGPSQWKLFANTFREAHFVEGTFPAERILAEHPDIVIELRVERSFVASPFITKAALELIDSPPVPSVEDVVLLTLDPFAAPTFDVMAGASVTVQGDGFAFSARDGKSGWILPRFAVPAGKRAWLKAEVESDTSGVMVAGVRRSASDPWLRRDATSCAYEAGRHTCSFALVGASGRPELRLSLLGASPRVILRHVEVHAGL
jgi:hypothetical protein